MSQETILPAIAIQTDAPSVDRPAPSVEEQKAVDDVFTEEQGQVVAALMAMQMGVTAVQLIADNNRNMEEEKEEPRRKKDEPAK